MASLALAFDILARDKNASATLDKVGSKAEHTGKRVGGAFSGLGKTLVGAFAGIATVEVFKSFIDEAEESRKVGRLTAQVIKSTGGAAGVTAKQVGQLATAISNKTGIDDEAIQSGQNLLLTFTGIRNEVGKGNDIFNQASSTITDMSVALGQDMKSSAIQVGKALNDPIRGVTALQRVGVSFTAQQKGQIAALVKSGKTLDAQKLILRELGKEFGGAAAAAATPSQKLKVTLDNLKESIGTALLPVIDKAASFLAEKFIPALYKVGGFLKSTLDPVFHAASEAVKVFFAALSNQDVTSVGTLGKVGKVAYSLRDAFTAVSAFVTGKVVPAFRQLWGFVSANIVPIFAAIVAVIATKVLPIFVAIGDFILTKFYPALAKIEAKVAKDLSPALQALGKFIRENVAPAVAGLAARIQAVLPTFEKIVLVVLKVVGVLLQLAAKILSVVIPILLKVAGPILTLIFAAFGKLVGIVAGVLRVFVSVFTGIGNAISGAWSHVIRPTLKVLVDSFLGMVGFLVNGAARAFGWVPGLGGKLKAAAKWFNKFRDDVNRSLSGINNKNVKVNIAVLANGKKVNLNSAAGQQLFASGGYVSGPGTGTSDSIPARLSNGEFVVSAAATKKYRTLLEAINGGAKPFQPKAVLAGEKLTAQVTSGGDTYYVTVNNPVPEPASNVPRALRTAAFLGG